MQYVKAQNFTYISTQTMQNAFPINVSGPRTFDLRNPSTGSENRETNVSDPPKNTGKSKRSEKK